MSCTACDSESVVSVLPGSEPTPGGILIDGGIAQRAWCAACWPFQPSARASALQTGLGGCSEQDVVSSLTLPTPSPAGTSVADGVGLFLKGQEIVAKELRIPMSIELPEGIFEQAAVLAQIQPLLNAFTAGMKDISATFSGEPEIVTPRIVSAKDEPVARVPRFVAAQQAA